MRRSLFGILATSALLVALTACSSSAGDTAADPMDSPLNKYFAAAWGGDLSEADQIEQFEQQQAQVEELVAECMTDEGFEYIPQTSTGSMSFSSGDEWKPDDREWVSQYGYGIVEYPGKTEMEEPVEEDEYVDVNADYVESLSESEQVAYNEALWGPPIPEEEMSEDGSYEWNWEDGGCQGWAQHESEGDTPVSLMNSDEHKPLMDAVNEFWSESMNDPAFAELDAAWANCMTDAGHPGFTTQYSAQESLYTEQNEIYEEFYGDGTQEVEGEPDMTEFGEREITLALADLDCREKTDYRAKQTEAQYAAEEEFVAAHKAELEAFKAAAEQAAKRG